MSETTANELKMDTNTIGYEVDFLAVGDGEKCGDAIALRFGNLLASPPEQAVVVIDGGFKDSGAALVKHIRDYYKAEIVDAVISTHPDNDHASGLETVLTELNVSNLVMHLPWNHTQNTSHLFEDDRVTDESVKRAFRESLETARNLEKLADKKGVNVVNHSGELQALIMSCASWDPLRTFTKTYSQDTEERRNLKSASLSYLDS